MAKPPEKLAESLKVLGELQNKRGIAIIKADQLSRTHRERLYKTNGMKLGKQFLLVHDLYSILIITIYQMMIIIIDGIPFIYNGQEIADTARHSIFGSAPVQWAGAETLAGKMRFDFVQRLCELYKKEKALTQGNMLWLENDQQESVLSYMREFDGEQILIVINLAKQPQKVHIQGGMNKSKPFSTLLSEDDSGSLQFGFEVQEYGFWIGKSQKGD